MQGRLAHASSRGPTTGCPPDGYLFACRAARQHAAATTHAPPRSAAIESASARSRNRAAAWAHDLHQWRLYRLDHARNDGERHEIEAEYEQRLEGGPDFASYREGSSFAEPPLHELDAEGKRQCLAAFDAVREWSFKNRKPRGQSVSLRYREVLRFLLSMAGKFGRVYPALATIARACSCSVKTVSNALAWLRAWGFLSWQRRIKRVQTALGTAVRQTSNAYRLALSRICRGWRCGLFSWPRS